MASVVFGGGITNIVGSHAGNTFARNKGGAYMKKKSLGTNPNSQRQISHRTKVGYLSKLYTHTLSDSDRSAWRAFAATNPVINRLGNVAFLSAQQMFCKLNATLSNPYVVYLTLPPASTAISSITGIVIDAVAGGGGHLKVQVNTTSTDPNEKAVIFVSPPMNPGRNFISSQLRSIGGHIAIDTNVTITTLYTNIFGALPIAAGGRIFVRALLNNLITGIATAPSQETTLWL